ncbi:MAG: trimethylamine methyltransferase family protein [Acidimicrobiales bacterium]|nr:trimethylamine methyltransferase family protein [Acidimicrobiales bacterium]
MTERAGENAAAARTGRRGGSRRNRESEGDTTARIQQPPYRHHRRWFEPTRAVSDDELEAIHHASLEVLRDIGIDVLNADARHRLAGAGALVAGDRVRFDPAMVTEYVARAPAEFTLHARNPAHDVRFGGDHVVFGAVASTPNVSDLAGGRRTGNTTDFRNLVRLSQHLNAVQVHGGYPVEPAEIHPSVRHLHATHDILTLSDKPIHAYSLGRQRNLDCLELSRIARGITDEQLDAEPSIYSIINTSSPLRLDDPMAQGIVTYAERNQISVITPFTLAGAMAPVTIAGAVTQQNAEALAGITLAQVTRPGAPVMYGGFTSNVDMKSGSPAFGTPEFMHSALLGGQLARRYGIPYRSSNVNAANAVDAQAAYESVFSLWGAIMGGANFVFHGAGWLEGGLRASFEKMVLDADLLQMVATFLQPLVVDDATMALEAIADVGPGGHFFGTQHTQDRYRTAFFSPMISDWRNFESWQEAGSPTADARAAEVHQAMLAEFEPPPIDEAIAEELQAFVERRVQAGGVPTDY